MNKTNSKKATASLETVTALLTCQPETKVDANGYSEKNVIDFMTIMATCSYLSVPDLLRLRKDLEKSFDKLKFIFVKFRHSKIQILLTPILKILIEQWPQNNESEYIFPFLRLTKKDEDLLQQVGSEGDDLYGQMLRRIEHKKIKSFHLNVNKYLAKMAARQNLDTKITLLDIQKTLKALNELAFPPSIDPLTIMRGMGDRLQSGHSLNEILTRFDSYINASSNNSLNNADQCSSATDSIWCKGV